MTALSLAVVSVVCVACVALLWLATEDRRWARREEAERQRRIDRALRNGTAER